MRDLVYAHICFSRLNGIIFAYGKRYTRNDDNVIVDYQSALFSFQACLNSVYKAVKLISRLFNG